MKKSHYTYLLYNGEQFYIGVRSCNGLPENDYGYLGSSFDKDFSNSIVAKTILRTFKTRKEASLHEIKLHNFHDVGVNPRFANKAKATTTGFCRQGIKHSAETLAKLSAASRSRIPYNKGCKLSAATRAKMSTAKTGLSHPKADHTIYIFCNETGETFTGTRFEFTEKYKINVRPLFNKTRPAFTTKGWRATCKLL